MMYQKFGTLLNVTLTHIDCLVHEIILNYIIPCVWYVKFFIFKRICLEQHYIVCVCNVPGVWYVT